MGCYNQTMEYRRGFSVFFYVFLTCIFVFASPINVSALTVTVTVVSGGGGGDSAPSAPSTPYSPSTPTPPAPPTPPVVPPPEPTPPPVPPPVPEPTPEPVSELESIIESIPLLGPAIDVITNAVEFVSNIVSNTISSAVSNFVSVASDISSAVSGVAISVAQNSVVVVTETAKAVVVNVVETTKVVARKTEEFVKSDTGKKITKVAEPIGVAAASAVVVTEAIAASASVTVTSFADLYLMFVRFTGVLFGMLRKKPRGWGTVYDSITKRPLDPAYIIVKNPAGKEVKDAITDLDGRYGFLLPEGNFALVASKTNYIFPSKKLAGAGTDELYSNLYYGESFENKEGEVIIKNIPMDPVGFDWNEFEKNKQNLFRIYSERGHAWGKVLNIFYFLGFALTIATAIFSPSTRNLIFLGIYVLLIIYQAIWSGKKKAFVVKNSVDGLPISFAILKVFVAEIGHQVKSAVADQYGRFYFLVGPGTYYITVEAKQSDGSYLKVKQTEPMHLTGGVMKGDIIV